MVAASKLTLLFRSLNVNQLTNARPVVIFPLLIWCPAILEKRKKWKWKQGDLHKWKLIKATCRIFRDPLSTCYDSS
ncbi:MAG: hypothetical protein ACJ71J_01010 [Nitrososphaeraceae archaeon]